MAAKKSPPRSFPLGYTLGGIAIACALAWKIHAPVGVEEQLIRDAREQRWEVADSSAANGPRARDYPEALPVWRESRPVQPFAARRMAPSRAESVPVTTQANPRFAQLPAWARDGRMARRNLDSDDLLDEAETLPSQPATPQRLPLPDETDDDELLLTPPTKSVLNPQEAAPLPAVAPAKPVPSLPATAAPAAESKQTPPPPATEPQKTEKVPVVPSQEVKPQEILNPTYQRPSSTPQKTEDEDDDLLNPVPQPTNPPAATIPPQTTDAGDEDDLLSPANVAPQPLHPQPPSTPQRQLFPSPPTNSSSLPESTSPQQPAVQGPTEPDPHWALFAKNCYPSAKECATCHQQHYDEWSVSSHAYACVSPMFHKFEQKINEIAQGTIGYFCMRCHAGAGVAMGMRRDTPLWEMPAVAREGVTCIVCHRVNQHYGKVNGERHIVPGPITDPIYGPLGGDGVREALSKPDFYKVKTVEDKKPGQVMHGEGRFFTQLNKSEFCESCHQVAVNPGIKLEVVWEQYRASPACKQGIRCQDCHMGKVPGKAEGFACGPAAIMNGKAVNPQRKHSNHIFHGPGYSIAHPGVFPFHTKADRWSVDQWLTFDWRAGWGTKEFEDQIANGLQSVNFPPLWKEADDRMDAREIIDQNLKKLAFKREVRQQSMENGSRLDGPFFDSQRSRGEDLKFHFVVTNVNPGHNLLTASLGAQPQYWLNVALVGPDGCQVWESGYTDQYGDLCDIHSEDVRHKRRAFDSQLFNLQTMFLITNVKGPDREFVLPVNVDFDQLPFIRPGAQPISVLNHPPFIRMEARSLAPLGSRKAEYKVPAHLLKQPGVYRLSYRMRSRLEPIYFMRFCGTTTEQQRSMNEGILDVHRHSVQFMVR